MCGTTIGGVHALESEVVFQSLGSSLLPEVHTVASVSSPESVAVLLLLFDFGILNFELLE